ncbi:FUSC family protein [Dyella flava]|uniref:FUSC family protein n=1 Tax=Dyella flava TaxID=1920170 RepID=A0ABS2K195_9GAMM|nr:FUSC family protein [Dyella flava]MBM7125025.1 FUSC family protein [Dyella flava]GLQ49982.1 fusaric acid transporter [Dyella flava]
MSHLLSPRRSACFNKLTFATGNVAAIFLALYIAFARNLERPYWAMFSVFIVAKPLAGAVRSKAVFRLVGTLVGASVAVFLVPPLVQSPELLCAAMAVWVGLCVCVAVLDRTPRNYVPTLAGYTVAIIAFSVVYNPVTVFDTAVSRVEEISLGIVCAALIHSLFFPRNTADELNDRLDTAITAITAWIDAAIREPNKADNAAAAQRLTQLMTNLHTAYTYIPYETSNVRRSTQLVRTLQNRLALLLPLFSNVQAGLAELTAADGINASVQAHMERAADIARRMGAARSAADLPGPIATSQLAFAGAGWAGQVEQATLVNLVELLNALRDCRLLAYAINGKRISFDAQLERDIKASAGHPFHVDRGLALQSGLAVAAAILIACAVWIGAAWPEGGVAVQFAAIGCSLFASMDNPAKLIRSAIFGIVVALPIGAVFEFAVLPRIDGFVSLALVLAPMLLLFSYMQTIPKLEGAALVLAITFSGSLALQQSYTSDFASFLNVNSAEIAGLLMAVVVNVVFRTIDPIRHALRISRKGWKEVGALARRRQLPDLRTWTMQMFDRHGMVTARVSTHQAVDRRVSASMDGLKDLRVGLDVAALITLSNTSDESERRALNNVLDAVADVYDAKAAGASSDHHEKLVTSIDDGLAQLSSRATDNSALKGITALVGLRLDLGSEVELHPAGALIV